MRALKTILPLFLLLSLAACQSPEREMVGHWRVDMEQIKRDPALSKIGPEARTLTERWSARMLQGWRFRFDADQHTELIFQGSEYRGTFEIVQRIGRSLRVRVRLRQLALNPIDMLLGITKNDQAESIELLFGLRFSGQNALLKFDEMPEIPLRRVAVGE